MLGDHFDKNQSKLIVISSLKTTLFITKEARHTVYCGDSLIIPPNSEFDMIIQANSNLLALIIDLSDSKVLNIPVVAWKKISQLKYGDIINKAMANLYDVTERSDEPNFRLADIVKNAIIVEMEEKTNQKKRISKSRTVSAIISFIIENVTNPELSISNLAREFNVSERMIQYHFAECGLKPYGVIMSERCRLLFSKIQSHPYDKIYILAMECGFHSLSAASRYFKREYGVTPLECKNQVQRSIQSQSV